MWKLTVPTLLVLLGLSDVAHASATITLTPASPSVAAGADVNVVLAYSIQGATAGDVLTVDLPPDVGIAGFQVPTDNNGQAAFGGGCTNVPYSMPWDAGCQFTFIGSGASSSGTIELTLRTARYAFPEGANALPISASFTSASGNANDAITLTVNAYADLQIWGGHFSINSSQLVSFQPAGYLEAVPGRLVRMTTYYYNDGNAPYTGLVHSVKLPTLAHYAGSNVPSGETPDTTIVSVPTPTNNRVTYALDRQVGRPSAVSWDGRVSVYGYDYADVVYTYYFIACDDLAGAYGSNGLPLGEQTLHPVYEADADVALVGGGSRVDTFDYNYDSAYTYARACSSEGGASKGHSPGGNRASGEVIDMTFAIYPPDRVPVEEVVAVDALPTNVTLLSTHSHTSTGYSTSFEYYLCRIPGSAGVLIPSATFLSTHRSNAATCWLKPNTNTPANPPWPIGETTHLALYAPVWADTGAFGTTIFPPYVVSQMRVDFEAQEGDLVTNLLHVDGDDFGPFDAVDTFGINNALNYIVALSSQQVPVHQETYNPGTADSPTKFVLAASFWRDGGLLLNPSMHVTLPPGIEPDLDYGDPNDAFVGYHYPLNCPGAPPVNTLPLPTWVKDTHGTADPLDDQWSITFDMDPIGPTDWYSQGCNASDYRHTNYFGVKLTPGFPFVTDAPNTATVTLDIENPSAIGPAAIYNFTALVRMPKEMRVTTVQGCGDGPAEPQIVAGYVNSAGTNLNNVVVTVPIPRVGSPAGTEVDTVFVAMTAPTVVSGGYTQEFSNDGTTWQPIAAVVDPADVRWVRTTLSRLDAYSAGTFGVTLRHIVPATPGDSITFIASIDSDELAPVDVLAPTEYIVGACYARVHVTKTFDDGAGGNAPLTGWTFEARRDGELVDSDTTDAEGRLTLELPPGTYQLAEVLPTAGQITWTPTSQAGPAKTITVAWEDELEFAFSNACTCAADPCATYDCVYPGECVIAEELECGEIVCDLDTGNVPDLICSETRAVAYAIVYDADDRPVGTVRCAQELDGTVACDEISPGKLHVYEGLFCPGIVQGDAP